MAVAAKSDPLGALARLEGVRSAWAPELARNQAYLDGTQPLAFMSAEMRKEFGDKIAALVLALPEIGAEAYIDRCDIEGFRLAGSAEGDEELWRVWQANNLDAQSVLGHTDAIGLGKACVIVGRAAADEDSTVAKVTVESAVDCAWTRDPRSGRANRGLKRWREDDGTEWASVYEDGVTTWLWKSKDGWKVDSDDKHGFPCSLIPLINRPKLKTMEGASEFKTIIPLVDAANKIATDMMQSAEYHAMPRRWAFGFKATDFRDKNGTQLSPWRALKNHIWVNERSPKDVAVGQFPEADLRNFHDTIKLLVQLASQHLALPSEYMSFTSVNPPSADAIRASEVRMVKRTERKHVFFGEAWEDTMRLAALYGGKVIASPEMLETIWRDPSTPTVAQKADAVMKLATAVTPDGRAIIPLEQARADLGYTSTQRKVMAEMDRASVYALDTAMASPGPAEVASPALPGA